MTKNFTFNIYCMSYKRADKILTRDVFEYCTYVVREEEAELYRNAGINDILVIPEGAVRNFMSTLYWIIDNTPEEVIFIADDDIKYMGYRLSENTPILTKDRKPDKETATAEVERIAQLLVDLNLGLAYDNPQPSPYVYDKEIAFKGMPGHVRWVNKSALKAKFDTSDPAASDIDMALQELLYNRIVLVPKYFYSKSEMDTNEGGVKKQRKYFTDRTIALKNKWGKYYNYDPKKNTVKINVKR